MLRQNRFLKKYSFIFVEIILCDPSMDPPDFILCIFIENSIIGF